MIIKAYIEDISDANTHNMTRNPKLVTVTSNNSTTVIIILIYCLQIYLNSQNIENIGKKKLIIK